MTSPTLLALRMQRTGTAVQRKCLEKTAKCHTQPWQAIKVSVEAYQEVNVKCKGNKITKEGKFFGVNDWQKTLYLGT